MAKLPVLKPAWRYFLSQQRVPNEVLYHYTSIPAFLNIIRTRSMWATELRFMNDPEELTYSENVVGKVLDDFTIRQHDGQRALWLAMMKKILHEHMDTSSYYSISFCEHHDLATQWDYYGASGSGIALGWSVDSPHREIPLRLGVVYEPGRQEQLVSRMIELHMYHFRKVEILKDNPRMLDSVGSLGIFLSVFLYNFKRSSFAEESEYRYVYQGLVGAVPAGMVLGHRRAETMEKPYVLADFSQAILRRVIVGPGADAGTKRVVREALQACGYADTAIYALSNAQLRSV